MPDTLDTDILVIGGGFGGCYAIWKMRQLGSVKCLEAAKGLGGVWRQNSYDGARVDVEMPFYSLDIPEVWDTWTWSERFPGFAELRKYFDHVTKVLDLQKDMVFDAEVVSAEYSDDTGRWIVKTRKGLTATAKFIVSCVGTSFKTYTPPFKNLSAYKGEIFHASRWPEGGVDIQGKSVAIVGSGATGIQIAQEWAKKAKDLTVFLRTPNLSLPMYQRQLTEQEQTTQKGLYGILFEKCRSTRSGLPYPRAPNLTFDNTPEEREVYLERIWQRGGFNFTQGLWSDFLRDTKANRVVYDFWAKKTRPRVTDPVKRDILAPLEPPHPYGVKRASLEQDYFEMLDKPNVHIVEVKKTPISEFAADGIITSDGKLRKFDAIALATGYDAVDGGLREMGIKDRHGRTLSQKWAEGIRTSLGMMMTDMPNLFVTYGPHSPSSFTNGPVFIQIQVDWVFNLMKMMMERGIKTVEPTEKAIEDWRNDILATDKLTLFPTANSWYNGGNVAGKKKEQMLFLKGIDGYRAELDAAFRKIQAGQSDSDFILHRENRGQDKVNIL